MQKIAVFGGTGMTGQCVVKLALKKGLEVRVLYRNELAVPDSFKGKVDLVKGDATRMEDVLNTVSGVDGVVIVLGTRNKLDPTSELSTGTYTIIQAMETCAIKNVSVCLSSFLFWDESKIPPQFEYINNEHKIMLKLLEESHLNYIAVLPPHIADEPPSEIAIQHDASPGRVISKWDLAKFLIDCLDQEQYYRKKWGLARKA